MIVYKKKCKNYFYEIFISQKYVFVESTYTLHGIFITTCMATKACMALLKYLVAKDGFRASLSMEIPSSVIFVNEQ